MARNHAKAKMEFYPTCNGDINDALLDIKATVPVRALDPSAGDGRTLKAIKEKFNTEEIYGVELEQDRVKETQKITGKGKTLWADALIESRIKHGGFNLIFMNPPYDYLDGYGHKRLETAFLERYTPVLCAGGIMVLVVAEALLKNSSSLHATTKEFLFKNFYIQGVQKSNDDTFSQWILILKKKKNPKLPKEYDAEYFDKVHGLSYFETDYSHLKEQQDSAFGYSEENLKMSIDVNPAELSVFYSERLSEEDIVKASGTGRKRIEQILTVLKPQNTFKTLLPMKKSHIALMLTTGGLNGRIEGTPLIVNGQIDRTVVKSSEEEEDEDGNKKTTERSLSKFTPKVSIMRIDTPEHEIIELH